MDIGYMRSKILNLTKWILDTEWNLFKVWATSGNIGHRLVCDC